MHINQPDGCFTVHYDMWPQQSLVKVHENGHQGVESLCGDSGPCGDIDGFLMHLLADANSRCVCPTMRHRMCVEMVVNDSLATCIRYRIYQMNHMSIRAHMHMRTCKEYTVTIHNKSAPLLRGCLNQAKPCPPSELCDLAFYAISNTWTHDRAVIRMLEAIRSLRPRDQVDCLE